MERRYAPGDLVVYYKPKFGPHPEPNALDVQPSPKGEWYRYEVAKYRRIDDVLEDGRVVLRTRSGKRRVLPADDPNLRHARWWERLLLRHRFPALKSN